MAEVSRNARYLVGQYICALQGYLESGDPVELTRADDLGRLAIGEGIGQLELAAVHHHSMVTRLMQVLSEGQGFDGMRAVEKFCASCPAWYEAPDETARTAASRDEYFGQCLSAVMGSQDELRKVNLALRRLNEIREEEAKRLAQALHDESSQLLVSVHLALEDIARDLPREQQQQLGKVQNLLDEAQRQLRHLSHELLPPLLGEMGLGAALEYLAEGVSRRSGIPVGVKYSARGRFPLLVETTLYRVVQEALTNASKHGYSSRIGVRISQVNGQIYCAIRDDGGGFDLEAAMCNGGSRGLGLAGIQQRIQALGGRVRITSRPGRGTAVVASVDLNGSEWDTPEIPVRRRGPVRWVAPSEERRYVNTGSSR